jgi:predicted metal-binding membrane protein
MHRYSFRAGTLNHDLGYTGFPGQAKEARALDAVLHNLELLLKRDRLLVSICLAIVTLLAAYYILDGAGMGMTALQMSEPMQYMGADLGREWTAADAVSMFLMWWVMMIAMMLPSAAPTILLAAALNRRARAGVPPYGNVAAFTLGYLLIWAAFSVFAAALQYWLQRAGMLSMHLESVNDVLTGALLVIAGLWQFSPLKNTCLSHCRSPVMFLTRYRRPGITGALYMGAHHGLYCLGCCWFLMALLFVGGVMNLYWIIGLAVFVFAEKVLLMGRTPGLIAGLVLIGWGAAVIAL